MILLIFCAFTAGSFAQAESFASIQERRPDLFHSETGFRISHQRGPTPDDIPPPSRMVDAIEVQSLLDQGAVPIDVFGALQSRYDDIDGTWLVKGPRATLPGAIWLPETGRGTLDQTMLGYFTSNLEHLDGGEKTTPFVFLCVADCWMSWNAAQRAASLGYQNVYWFRDGTDGWVENGFTLSETLPIPVDTD